VKDLVAGMVRHPDSRWGVIERGLTFGMKVSRPREEGNRATAYLRHWCSSRPEMAPNWDTGNIKKKVA